MSDRCGDCWQIEGNHKHWCSVSITKKARRQAFLEVAKMVEGMGTHHYDRGISLVTRGVVSLRNDIAILLREKAEE